MTPLDQGRQCADLFLGTSKGYMIELREVIRTSIEYKLDAGKDDTDDSLCFLLGVEDRLTENLKRLAP